jgi:transketolase
MSLTNIKKNILRMAHYSYASHVGAALSVAEILYVLYGKVAKINKQNINSTDRDKVILSKGHASTALYCTLAEFDILPKEYLDHYYVDGGILPGHLDKDSVPGIDASAGSLGHGLSLGVGMALAKPQYKVFVVQGDGESQEGSVWEAITLASALKIKNITLIIDINNLQGFGNTNAIIPLDSFEPKFKAFGWETYSANGHNLKQIEDLLLKPQNGPKVILARTIKGHGISYMENQLKWHYQSPNAEELKQGYKELENAEKEEIE